MKIYLILFLFLNIGLLTVSCDRKLVTDEVVPSDKGTSEFVKGDDNFDAIYCPSKIPGYNPFIPEKNDIIAGYARFYNGGTDPFPCWVWGSAVYRGAFRFDLSKYTDKKIVSAILNLDLGQAQYSSGATASNEGVWIKEICLATSGWMNKPSPYITNDSSDLFSCKEIPGMPDLPTGINSPEDKKFPVKYNGAYSLQIDVTNVVRDWLDGKEQNLGFVLKGKNEKIAEKSNATALSPVKYVDLAITYTVQK